MPRTLQHAPSGRRAGSPAAETLERLDRRGGQVRLGVVPARPGDDPARSPRARGWLGPGWFHLDGTLTTAIQLDAWLRTELRGPASDLPDVAGSLVAYRYAEALADLVVGPLVAERRVVRPGRPGPTALALRLGDPPRLAALAVAAPSLAVLPGDSDGGRPSTHVLAGARELLDLAAGLLVAHFEPLTAAVRARAPYGLRGMWGALADHVAEAALRHAPPTSAPGAAPAHATPAWATAQALIARIAHRQPLLRGRPRTHRVASPSGPALYIEKGTCCLVYKAHRPPAASAGGARPAGRTLIDAAACDVCPLRAPVDRHDRLAAWGS